MTALWFSVALGHAERLPIKVYTTADGIASNELGCIVRDSRDFLWFCTSEGLSRFDGQTFRNYGADQGMPGRAAVDFLQTRNGEYWVATATGLARFNPQPSAQQTLFEAYHRPEIHKDAPTAAIAEAPDGNIWYLTTNDLFRFRREARQFETVDLGPPVPSQLWTSLLADDDGSLWIGSQMTLARRLPDGRVEHYGEAEGIVGRNRYFRISSIFRDREKRLWLATWDGLGLMESHPQPGKHSVARFYTEKDGLPPGAVFTVFQSSGGTIWAGSSNGLSELIPGNGAVPDRFRTYTAQNGFGLYGQEGPPIGSIAEDASGNLWMSGAIRLARGGFTTYTTQDGLKNNGVGAVVEDREGRLIVFTGNPRPEHFNVFESAHFRTIEPRVPGPKPISTWGANQIHFQDHTGTWWFAGTFGLFRYPKGAQIDDLAGTLPEQKYTQRDGLPGDEVFRLFEDSRGDVWISIVGSPSVARWLRNSGRFENIAAGPGKKLDTPTAFAEDRSGNIWMSLYWHDLVRYRGGHLDFFTAADGLPEGAYPALYVDHAGRLWMGTRRGGLARVDDPNAERPHFRYYNAQSGLSSDGIRCITEDQWGRIYAGTDRGLDQLDPATGRVRHYTYADGLGPAAGFDRPLVAFRDRHGALWFGGIGLSRFVPQPENPLPRPPLVRITSVRTRGGPRAISELGESSVRGIRLLPDEGDVQIDFASLDFGVGETVRYQYRMEGTAQDWTAPAESRSVNYASLAPGHYRFLVRAVKSDGLTSMSAASVEFVVLPPLWRRWWFVTLAASLFLALALAAHRYRLRQLLEMERVRTRIATDLHDDIGSSLTQIAILSEVARRSPAADSAERAEPLVHIADLSRELVDSMSDIVWAINPKRDHLCDLEHRMRRFASDVLASRDIEFDFVAPAEGQTPVRTEVRRHVFLIFKECVHNMVRHAGCRKVRIEMLMRGGSLVLRMSDDGKGFAQE
ncbi:MAG TPA: two-component regulator propeller domain-containing protein, partial [Bryobacteraceae bacterium]|nr:two-component regulator propeller domain-containing protein [Bryobacteraceae bacterium]